MKLASLFICLVISILCCTSTYAFDGKRKGFILGGGLGVAYLSNNNFPDSWSDTKSRLAFQTNFKIGYAPSNTLEIFYSNRVSWWSRSGLYVLGLNAATFTLYFDSTSETDWFVSGGIGFSSLAEIKFDNVDSGSGFGLFGGAGYEFSRHWTVEVDLLYSHVTVRDNDCDFFGVLVTINVLAF